MYSASPTPLTRLKTAALGRRPESAKASDATRAKAVTPRGPGTSEAGAGLEKADGRSKDAGASPRTTRVGGGRGRGGEGTSRARR